MAESKALDHFEGAIDHFELLVLERYHIGNLMVIILAAEALDGLLPHLVHCFLQCRNNLDLGHRNCQEQIRIQFFAFLLQLFGVVAMVQE